MSTRKLGRYEILEELGRGAMGRVYLAHDPQIDRRVALKTVQGFEALPEGERAEARECFLNEARSAGKLMHPGIVTLFDVGEAGEMLYLAMEFVDGATLDAFCKPEALLPVKTVASLVADVAEALHYAHMSGVVHRDIKPANLMRVTDDRVKIMDLGLARPTEAQLTQDGSLLGTPSYMAPEQIRGGRIDGRADLFSLGVVLFELLTGQRPFPGDTISATLYRIVHDPAPRASKVNPRVSADLETFLERALSKDPEARFGDGQQFADALRQSAAAAPPEPPPPPGSSAPPQDPERPVSASLRKKPERPPRTSPMPFVIGLIVVLALVGGAGWAFREDLGLDTLFQPRVVLWEATVRTQPPGLPVQVDGDPLDPAAQGIVQFKPEGPFPVLSASQACRTAEHPLSAADAGGEVVLLVDPVELEWPLDPGVEGATVQINGAEAGAAPVTLALDLCRDNRIQVAAAGFRPAAVELEAGVTPLAARTRLAGLALDRIPRGTLTLPDFPVSVVYYLDGRRLKPDERSFELEEGSYKVRIKNEALWIDSERTIRVVGGESVTSELKPPPLTTLVVQAFPPNCKVELRRPGGSFRYLDEVPLSRRIAAGKYEVRITLNPTGESRVETVDLVPGSNPPLRVAFGNRG